MPKPIRILSVPHFLLKIAALILCFSVSVVRAEDLRIAILTDLSAKMPQWGQQTAAGARLAQADLRTEGISLELIVEDHAMQPARAVTAARKVIDADRVDAVYTEFSIPSSAIAPIVEQSRILTVFNAPLDSAIRSNPRAFRTFIDYRAMCSRLAEKWKNLGIDKVSLIRIASESGDICIEGLKTVYNNYSVDLINSGDDLRPILLRQSQSGSKGLINLALEPDVQNSLTVIRELHLPSRLGIPINMLSDPSRDRFKDQLERVDLFGFDSIDPGFAARLEPGGANREAAALAYTHLMQIARAIHFCKSSNSDSDQANCRASQLSRADAGGPIGFVKWNERVAQFNFKMVSAGAVK